MPHKNIRLRFNFCPLLVFVMWFISAHALSQETVNDSDNSLKKIYQSDTQIENTSRIIDVNKTTSDEKIKQRLTSILNSSKKYLNLDIKTHNGLVFLEGNVNDNQYIEWASDIAKNIDGVIAVINNIETTKSDYFTLDPIKNEIFKLWFKGLEVLPLVVLGFVTFFIFFLLSRPIANMLMRPINYLSDSELIRIVIRKIISIFITAIGFYFFLKIAGLTQFALAIISGTGLMGLALGFAFRDIAENFISSLLLSIQRPFQLGDVIEVNNKRGIVRKVTTRGTTLVDFDGNHIQIPNAIIYKSVIQNYTANPNQRGKFIIGIGYDASIQLAQELAMNLMIAHEAVLKEPEPQVLIDNLGSSTVNLQLYFWVNGHEYSLMKVSSVLMRQVKSEFERNGISMPDDAREIIFPDGVPITMENSASPTPLKPNRSIGTRKRETNQLENNSIKKDNTLDADEFENEDLSSDTDDIQRQAERARDPEEGASIIK